MINTNSSLTVLHDDNSTFVDYSHKVASFGRDKITLNIINAEDYIYIGFSKPIHAIYINVETQSGTEGSLNAEIYDGSNWVSISSVSDDTLGMYRSGFVQWDRAQTNQVESSVNSITKYWYRFKPSVDRTGIVLSGLNLVFSDDYELSLLQPYINSSEFLGSESSHIKIHSAVKNEIIQKFSNADYIITEADGVRRDINIFDLHAIHEVKLAATFLAISNIYYNMSDDADDVWSIKSKDYNSKYEKFINIARLSVDVNDDGIVDDVENKPSFKSVIMRR